MKRQLRGLGWRLMGTPQNWPFRGWRWRIYRFGAWLNNLT